jgi:hypothetical protein
MTMMEFLWTPESTVPHGVRLQRRKQEEQGNYSLSNFVVSGTQSENLKESSLCFLSPIIIIVKPGQKNPSEQRCDDNLQRV